MSEEVVSRLEDVARKEGRSIGEIILERGVLTNEQMGQLMSMQTGLSYAHLKQSHVPEEVLAHIPLAFAVSHQMIAFKEDEEGVHVATSQPYDQHAIDLLRKKLDQNVVLHYATPNDIKLALHLYKSDLSEQINKLAGQLALSGASKESEAVEMAQLVDLLIEYAYNAKSSDMHIEPQESDVIIRFRVDGVLNDILSFDKKLHDQLVTRIKILARLRTDEHFAAQDGHIKHDYDGESVDLRISILPTVHGEKVVMRLLAEKSRQFTLEELGMTAADLEKLEQHAKKPWGMILVTGPTGSGKTTTLYAVLKLLNRREVNISTIEDPVEYSLGGINQIQVNPRAKLTFATGLRSIVRQDPDIIMVGEIRDPETGDIAVNAALTGHLLLSTLHTNDAATSLPRLIEMEVEPFLVASTVNVVLAQRLIRRVCPRCISSGEYTVEQIEEQGHVIPDKAKARLFQEGKATLFHGEGCSLCNHSGYYGRMGIFEILEIDSDIRKMILAEQSSDVIKDYAVAEHGMTTMFDDALEKVAQGQTTLAEILRVVRD